MTTIYYSLIKSLPAVEKAAAAQLPSGILEKIAIYKDPGERALRMLGKILLQEAIRQKGLALQLEDLYHEPSGRPVFPGDRLRFSIAHAGRLVICAFTTSDERIGIDAEELRRLPLTDLRDELTLPEWELVIASAAPYTAFLKIWTRKEAVLKAAGRGTATSFAALETLGDPVILAGALWHWQEVHLVPGYCVHLASSRPVSVAEIKEYAYPGLAHQAL